MKRPCTKRVPSKAQKLPVAAQIIPQAVMTHPPVRIMGLIGNRSAALPKGRLERAIPRITADTVKDARVSFIPNSTWRIGSTG